MNKATQELIECASFLTANRKGYKYSFEFSFNKGQWCATVIGTCVEDNSKPAAYISVQAEDFEQIPQLVRLKAEQQLRKEIEGNLESVARLTAANAKLESQVALLAAYKSRID